MFPGYTRFAQCFIFITYTSNNNGKDHLEIFKKLTFIKELQTHTLNYEKQKEPAQGRMNKDEVLLPEEA